jgi:hypothetical protein
MEEEEESEYGRSKLVIYLDKRDLGTMGQYPGCGMI